MVDTRSTGLQKIMDFWNEGNGLLISEEKGLKESRQTGAEGPPAEISPWNYSPPIAVTGDPQDQRPPCLLSCKTGSWELDSDQ